MQAVEQPAEILDVVVLASGVREGVLLGLLDLGEDPKRLVELAEEALGRVVGHGVVEVAGAHLGGEPLDLGRRPVRRAPPCARVHPRALRSRTRAGGWMTCMPHLLRKYVR